METKSQLRKITADAQARMLVRTDLAVPSGQGSAMHSKSGAATIPQYTIFKEEKDKDFVDQVQEEEKQMVELYKDNKVLLTLALAEHEMFGQGVGANQKTLQKLQQFDLENRNQILRGLPVLPKHVR